MQLRCDAYAVLLLLVWGHVSTANHRAVVGQAGWERPEVWEAGQCRREPGPDRVGRQRRRTAGDR